MKILVTGATGFLGSHICRALAAHGHRVRALVHSPSRQAVLAGIAVEAISGDITDRRSVESAIDTSDAVIHAAADVSDWTRDATAQMRVNVDGTRCVAEACRARGTGRMVHISSVAAIGIPTDTRPANEGFAFNLEDSGLAYHLSKRRAEEVITRAVAGGLDAVIVNPGSIKGPDGGRFRGGEIVEAVRRAPLVPYFTGGISVVHVEDVADGVLAALERGARGERYILGGDNLSFRALAERVAAALRLHRLFVPFAPPLTGLAHVLLGPWSRLRNHRPYMTHTVHYCASRFQFYDSTKARMALGYAPRGFDAIVAEYLRGTTQPQPDRVPVASGESIVTERGHD